MLFFFFLDQSPKAKEMKAKINKQDLIKHKRFCTVKEIMDETKRQPAEWEKIFAKDMTYKGLTSKIYKQLIQLNIKKRGREENAGGKKFQDYCKGQNHQIKPQILVQDEISEISVQPPYIIYGNWRHKRVK